MARSAVITTAQVVDESTKNEKPLPPKRKFETVKRRPLNEGGAQPTSGLLITDFRSVLKR